MPGKHAAPARAPKKKKKGRKIAVVLLCLVLIGAAGYGGYYTLQNRSNGKEVNVYPMNVLGYIDDWSNKVQTGGTVEVDKMQAVRLSSTQTVTEIYVEEGQQVEVGDKILSFDTTLSEVELEKARIEIEKKKLDIQDAQKELEKISTYRIGYPGSGIEEPEETPELPPPLQSMNIPFFEGGAGTPEDPFVYLWEEGRFLNDETIRSLLGMAVPTPSPEPTFESIEDSAAPQPEGPAGSEPPASAVPGPSDTLGSSTQPESSIQPEASSQPEGEDVPVAVVPALENIPTPVGRDQGVVVRPLLARSRGAIPLLREAAGGESEPTVVPAQTESPSPTGTEPAATAGPMEPPAGGSAAPEDSFVPLDLETPVAPVEDEPWAEETPPAETSTEGPTPESTDAPGPSAPEEPTEDPNSSPSASPSKGPSGAEYYMVFEIRDSQSMNGDILRAFEIHFVLVEGEWDFEVVEPAYEPYDYTVEPEGDDQPSSGGFSGEFYTPEEIAKMRTEANQKLQDLNLDLRVAEQQLKEKEFELSNGEVLCTTAGIVKSVITPEEALAADEPVVRISGGGGYFIQCYMSEFDLAYMQPGDTVAVEDYRNGVTLDGTITEISEYPAGDIRQTNYYYQNGNINVTTYPFTIEVSEEANLREGYGVSVTYAPNMMAQEEQGITDSFQLDNSFIRKEGNRSYVYVEGENGLLEKRYITTAGGDSYSTRVTGGLDLDTDYVAFPYGRAVKEGAKTVEQETLDSLYSGY